MTHNGWYRTKTKETKLVSTFGNRRENSFFYKEKIFKECFKILLKDLICD